MGLVFGAATAGAVPNAYYLRGTNIGTVPPDPVYRAWVDQTITATAGEHGGPTKVEYPGGFWPVSKGYLSDPTYNKSVDQGVASLAATIAAAGDADSAVIISGYSQGAVAATEYMRAHPGAGNTYVLAANPNRPNGGILQRFNGLYVPILDISFNGATPTSDEIVIDIARQYDGWADFPKYPLNVAATANALLGIIYLHGKYDQTVTPELLADLEPTTHGNTTYYLVPTERLPLLMPFGGIVPDSVLDALDPPLRAIVELGYDRTDYGVPTPAKLLAPISPVPAAADRTEATAEGIGTPTPDPEPEPEQRTQPEIEAATAAVEPDSDEDPLVRERPARTIKRPSASPEQDTDDRRESRRTALRDKKSESSRPDSESQSADDDRAPAAAPRSDSDSDSDD